VAVLLEAIKNFVADLASDRRPAGGLDDDSTRLAMAALLVHAGSVDGDFTRTERAKLADLLKRRFDLDEAAVGELIERAIAADREAIDLYRFTRAIKTLDANERLRMVELMWTIAYADGAVSEFEDHLIWRVADLLGVSQHERIALRQRIAKSRPSGGS
jgi:uncharacterized tellurite resistance protein B-like protein